MRKPRLSPMKPWLMYVRIVLDTNVIVSALITREGQPGRLLDALKRGNFTLVTSGAKKNRSLKIPK